MYSIPITRSSFPSVGCCCRPGRDQQARVTPCAEINRAQGGACIRCVVIPMLLLAMPAMASADQRLTYKCTGKETTDGGMEGPDHIHEVKFVSSYFTLTLTGSSGRYYDWQKHSWQPIQSITEGAFQLYGDQAGPALHAYAMAQIDRKNGAWSMSYAGGGGSVITQGKCIQVPLREPPSA